MIDSRATQQVDRIKRDISRLVSVYEDSAGKVRQLSAQLKQEARRATSLQRKAQGSNIDFRDSQIIEGVSDKVSGIVTQLRVQDKLLSANIRKVQDLQNVVKKISPDLVRPVQADVQHMINLRRAIARTNTDARMLLKLTNKARGKDGVPASILLNVTAGLSALAAGLATIVGAPVVGGVIAVGALGLFGVNTVLKQIEALRGA